MSTKIRFFNFFRNIVRLTGADRLLISLTKGKGYGNFFVKCLPQNYQYPSPCFRKVKRNGIWFNLDLSEYMEWVIYFDLNVENRDDLYPLVKPGMHIFDVGTNIGETALNFAMLSGKQGSVVGFEPVPATFGKCRMNLQLNDFPWLKVENLALSDKSETLFFDPATYHNSGGIFMRKVGSDAACEVGAVTLDDYCSKNAVGKIDLLKIDVEGFELNVLKGAQVVLRKMRPILFVEINNNNLNRQNASAGDIFDLLGNLNYSVVRCDGGIGPVNEGHYDIIARPSE